MWRQQWRRPRGSCGGAGRLRMHGAAPQASVQAPGFEAPGGRDEAETSHRRHLETSRSESREAPKWQCQVLRTGLSSRMSTPDY